MHIDNSLTLLGIVLQLPMCTNLCNKIRPTWSAGSTKLPFSVSREHWQRWIADDAPVTVYAESYRRCVPVGVVANNAKCDIDGYRDAFVAE